MRKLVIGLVIAGLHTGAAFAASAGEAAGRAAEEIGAGVSGSREAIRPGARSGSKLTATGAARDNSASFTGTQGATSAANQVAAIPATGVNSHFTCPVDSPMKALNAREQEAIFAAAGAGLAGSACATNFTEGSTVQIVSVMDQAKLDELHNEGHDSLNQASKAEKLQIVKAEALALASKVGTTAKDAVSRINSMCKSACDVDTADLCQLAPQVAM